MKQNIYFTLKNKLSITKFVIFDVMRLLIILIFLIFSKNTFASNPFWVYQDKKMFRALFKVDFNNPKAMEKHFKKHMPHADKNQSNHEYSIKSIGFGWKRWETIIYGGRTSLSAIFYYFQDSIITYSLSYTIPEDEGLKEMYRNFRQNQFKLAEFNYYEEIFKFDYNRRGILKPLNGYAGPLKENMISEKLKEFMTFESLNIYSVNQSFNEIFLISGITDSINGNLIELLMYSLNPYVRILATRHFLDTKKHFSNKEYLYTWVEQLANENIPIFEQYGRCIVRPTNNMEVFKQILKNKIP